MSLSPGSGSPSLQGSSTAQWALHQLLLARMGRALRQDMGDTGRVLSSPVSCPDVGGGVTGARRPGFLPRPQLLFLWAGVCKEDLSSFYFRPFFVLIFKESMW